MEELKTTGQRVWSALRGEGENRYWLTRFTFLRGVGLVYFVAFLVSARQSIPLLGSDGIFPIDAYLAQLDASWWSYPTLFWLWSGDWFMAVLAWTGVVLSLLVLIGRANALLMAALWLLYLSFVNVGQLFYAYGWETLLLEIGFLAIFLPPIFRSSPLPEGRPPPTAVIWLLRWLLFRVMFGAGLIKLRADPCWDNLTCLQYHYETQPIPNPVSWYLHHAPTWFHTFGVVWNHFIELVVPIFIFAPRRIRHVAGVLLASFQVTLIVSGNLSFLNWMTLVVCIACFDDSFFRWVFPESWYDWTQRLADASSRTWLGRGLQWCLVAGIAFLSVNPVLNMISPSQAMNRSFSNYHLVNTYGAFGSVTRDRYEIVIQGTHDPTPGADTEWKSYEFPCKPGAVRRRPCLITPYHYRLDWQMWFAAMSSAEEHPWFMRFAYRLLEGHRGLGELFADNPFPHKPPRYIRAVRYRYEFSDSSDTEKWWTRQKVGMYLPPVSLQTEWFREYLVKTNFIEAPHTEPDP